MGLKIEELNKLRKNPTITIKQLEKHIPKLTAICQRLPGGRINVTGFNCESLPYTSKYKPKLIAVPDVKFAEAGDMDYGDIINIIVNSKVDQPLDIILDDNDEAPGAAKDCSTRGIGVSSIIKRKVYIYLADLKLCHPETLL